MFRRVAIVLAILGALVVAYVVATARVETPAPPPEQPPSTNPFASGIVAIGIVEPAGRVVDVAAPESGRVVEVFADVNDTVARGDPLFRLDGRLVEADLIRARAAVDTALAEVERLEQSPRPEDLPPAQAEVDEAQQRLADAQDRLGSLSEAREGGGASEDEYRRQQYLVQIAQAAADNAQARLDRLRAGAWEQDLAVARAIAEARRADVRAAELRLARLTVNAPLTGTILKRNIEAGEFTAGAASSPTAMPGATNAPFVLGNLAEMHVRAQVDEEDTPLLQFGARAIARVRGPLQTRIPLEMLRIEPLARPKTQISGASTELVDTRVIEVIFIARPDSGAPTLYPGQIVDVFIDAGDASAPSGV